MVARLIPRTRCVYCGERIGGSLEALPGWLPHFTPERRRELRIAAKLACRTHLGLVALDPEYEYVQRRSLRAGLSPAHSTGETRPDPAGIIASAVAGPFSGSTSG